MTATFWRPDPELTADLRCPASRVLHREAGKRGMSCSPKRSHIDRGSYYAEITVHRRTGNTVPSPTPGERWPEFELVPNAALGVGRTALSAALDGYLKLLPANADPIWSLVVMEVEVELLRRAVAVARKEQETLDKLEVAVDLLRATVAVAQMVVADGV